MKKTEQERADLAHSVVTDALTAMRSGDKAEANQLLAHAVHDGVPPVELAAEIIAQTGGAP